ncbi:MAG: succinate dehydrogenase assembly factor 2 [Wenzhouxiangellaceae bacterium]|nr:succinate dehydrogenase assembly factor 2 [Wenzhouxiangellaceae bacterium]
MTETNAELARLRWRCRRGMQELDFILGNWLTRHGAGADDSQRRRFDRLLDCEDDLIWDWILGRSRPEDAELATMVDELMDESKKFSHPE